MECVGTKRLRCSANDDGEGGLLLVIGRGRKEVRGEMRGGMDNGGGGMEWDGVLLLVGMEGNDSIYRNVVQWFHDLGWRYGFRHGHGPWR